MQPNVDLKVKRKQQPAKGKYVDGSQCCTTAERIHPSLHTGARRDHDGASETAAMKAHNSTQKRSVNTTPGKRLQASPPGNCARHPIETERRPSHPQPHAPRELYWVSPGGLPSRPTMADN